MTKAIKVSIVIPCFNEARNLRLGALARVAYFLEKKTFPWEVLIVDDGSTDDSRDLIIAFIRRNPKFVLSENKHQGKAATVLTGMVKAQGKYILFTDLDQATPITELDKLLPWFEHGYDIVIGSRSAKREGSPLLRYLMARGFMLLRELILGLKGIQDTQCGFKAFSQKAVKTIVAKLELYKKPSLTSGPAVTAGFDVELLYIAKLCGFEIREVPVEWYYVESRRISPLKDSYQAVIDLLRIRLNSLRGVYA